MNSPPDSSNSDICEPPYIDWSANFQQNVAARARLADCLAPTHFPTMREEIIAAAQAFTTQLNTIAREVGLAAPAATRHLDNESISLARRPIVATGHQPVIFHPGILAKNLRLEQFVAQNDAVGLMVLIDSDEGDASRFVFPSPTETKQLTLQTATLGNRGDLFLSQTLGASEAIAKVANRVKDSLVALGFDDAARQSDEVLQQYAQLNGKPAAIANSIIRRIWEGRPSYLEVLLSEIVSLPSIRQFMQSLINNGPSLHETYNSTLNQYRADHKIRNRANPFPNLASDDESIELPFWIVDPTAGTRIPLHINRKHPSANIAPSSRIVPKGMLITTILRLMASDLFIHGTGGAKYDRCTDRFVSKMFQTDPPKFVAATATRHLFEDELEDIAESRALREQVQEVYSRFKRHTESGTFHGDEQVIASQLLSRRTDAIGRLKMAKSAGRSASEVNQELKAVDSDIMAFVEQAVTKGVHLNEPSRETLQILENRTFPYFFFSKPIPSAAKLV